MLQRIQTIYLLISFILSGLMIFFPILEFNYELQNYELQIKGLMLITEEGKTLIDTTILLSILTITIPLITLLTINMYKHRILQIRLSVFNTVLMLGYYGMFFITKHILTNQYQDAVQHIEWPIIMPIISAILTVLAIIAIGKDEVLVKSLDRLR